MRIKIMFEEYPKEVKKLRDLEIWIEFPCRIYDNDMICHDILGATYNDMMKDYYRDNPEVACHSFDIDEKGIYQNVWLIV